MNPKEEYERFIEYMLDFDPMPPEETITIRRIIKEVQAHPNFVTRTDQTIVAWNDVPEHIQKKILSGTMTEEDWDSDWFFAPKTKSRNVDDIVSDMLNDTSKHALWGSRHVHIWRKEYNTCMIKDCGAKK